MDKIKIKDLELYCHHGVLKEETILGQKFLVTVTFYLHSKLAGDTDEITDSINYAEASYTIKQFMEENTYQLLEAAAENLVKHLLIQYKMAKKIKLKLKKPWAPILLPLDTVSVEITRKWHTVYLSIGSNLGNKKENLEKALNLLEEEKDSYISKRSSLIVTKPVGEIVQDDFLNGAIELKTLKSPSELLQLIKNIEEKLKRVRTVHWGPRIIDLDIIYYDSCIMDTEELIIPHSQMQYRSFVLEPLLQIAPDKVHPVLKKSVKELMMELR